MRTIQIYNMGLFDKRKETDNINKTIDDLFNKLTIEQARNTIMTMSSEDGVRFLEKLKESNPRLYNDLEENPRPKEETKPIEQFRPKATMGFDPEDFYNQDVEAATKKLEDFNKELSESMQKPITKVTTKPKTATATTDKSLTSIQITKDLKLLLKTKKGMATYEDFLRSLLEG